MLTRHADYLGEVHGYVVFSEIYVTNKHGVIIGSTGRTTDYLQADEEWYRTAAMQEAGWIRDVRYNASSGFVALDLVVPLHDHDGRFVGIVKAVLNIEDVEKTVEFVQSRSHYENTRAYLVDSNGRAVSSGPSAKLASGGRDVTLEEFGEDLTAREAVAEALEAVEGFHVFTEEGIEKLAVFCRSTGESGTQGLGWSLIVEYDTDEVLHDVLTTKYLLTFISLVITLLAVAGGILFARSISLPIKSLTAAASGIAQGNLDAELEHTQRRDEIGALARTFNHMARSLAETNACLEDEHAQLRKNTVVLEQANESLRTRTAELQESRKRYRLLLETISDFVWEVDQDDVFTYANPKTQDLLGYDPKEVVGKKPFDFMSADEVDRIHGLAGEVFLPRKPFVGVEVTHLHKNGRQVVLEVCGVPVFDDGGNYAGYRGISRDVTHRRKAQASLRASEERFRTAFEQGPIGMSMEDFHGKIFRANRSLCEMLGYDIEELANKNVLDLTHPDDVETDLAFKQRMKSGEIPGYTLQKRYVRKNGQVAWGRLTAGCVCDEHGNPAYVLAMVEDVTQRKKVDEFIRQEQENLRQMLELNDRDRQLTAYEIHDGPAQHLFAAQMHLQVFEQLREQNPGKALESFNSGMRLLGTSLAEVRRLISGLRPPILDEFGLVAAIEHIVIDCKGMDGPEIEFFTKVKFNRLAPPLENALFRIVQECLTNACRYSCSDKVRITLAQENDVVRIEVQDGGVGFNPQEVNEGSFGLAGIRQRARLLGGHATIDSSPGEGTSIVAELPLVESKTNGLSEEALSDVCE